MTTTPRSITELTDLRVGQTIAWRFAGKVHTGEVTSARWQAGGRYRVRVNNSNAGPDSSAKAIWILEDAAPSPHERLAEAFQGARWMPFESINGRPGESGFEDPVVVSRSELQELREAVLATLIANRGDATRAR